MKFKAIIIFLFFLTASFPIIRVPADWEKNSIIIVDNERIWSSNVEYYVSFTIGENQMGDISHKPSIYFLIEPDPSDPFYKAFFFGLSLYQCTESEFLTGSPDQYLLDYYDTFFYTGVVEDEFFWLDQFGDYVVTFKEISYHDAAYEFLATVKIEVWYYSGGPTTISINGNDDFINQASSEGWLGDGTSSNPYIIEGLKISDPSWIPIDIRNVDLHFIISNCLLMEGEYAGISFLNVKNGKISHNNVSNNKGGIYLTSSSNNIISDNVISNSNWPLQITDSSTNSITNNSVFNNNYGIQIFDFPDQESKNNIFTKNIMKNNTKSGIALGAFSSNNEVKWNDFIGNNPDWGDQARDAGTNNLFTYNYWDDWTNPDEDTNGVVDNPYSIDGDANNEDPFPLVFPVDQYSTLPSLTTTTTTAPKTDSTFTPTYTTITGDYKRNEIIIYDGQEDGLLFFNTLKTTYFNFKIQDTYFDVPARYHPYLVFAFWPVDTENIETFTVRIFLLSKTEYEDGRRENKVYDEDRDPNVYGSMRGVVEFNGVYGFEEPGDYVIDFSCTATPIIDFTLDLTIYVNFFNLVTTTTTPTKIITQTTSNLTPFGALSLVLLLLPYRKMKDFLKKKR